MNENKHVGIRELADSNTSISSTRWAFATVIKFDIAVIFVSIVTYSLFHLIGKPFDESYFYGIGTLLGILTTLVTTSKALQGFEPKDSNDKPSNKDSFEGK